MLRAVQNESFAPMFNSLPRVLIAVCTYKRPKMLEACLSSLLGQNTEMPYALLVVDNSWAKEGHIPFIHAQRSVHLVDMHYLCEPRRGIASARNAALRFARENGFSYLAFTDDDAVADSKWLEHLMNPDFAGAAFVQGRNIINYGDGIPQWQIPKFKPPRHGEGCIINRAATNNVLIGPALLKSGFWFDASLGLGGGEDSDFFRRACKAGFYGVKTNKALTFEAAHPERLTTKGQYYREFWKSAGDARWEVKYNGGWKRGLKRLPRALRATISGLFQIAWGGMRWIVNRDAGKRQILRGAKSVARGQGYLAGIVGYIPQAYEKTVGA